MTEQEKFELEDFVYDVMMMMQVIKKGRSDFDRGRNEWNRGFGSAKIDAAIDALHSLCWHNPLDNERIKEMFAEIEGEEGEFYFVVVEELMAGEEEGEEKGAKENA